MLLVIVCVTLSVEIPPPLFAVFSDRVLLLIVALPP
jgi:hypothetical protein